jgi:hypothetical protein
MELPEDIFQELTAGGRLAPAVKGSTQRCQPRVAASMRVMLLRLNGDRNNKPMAATICDMSISGLGIEFSEPIHVNDGFAVRLQRKDGSAMWLHCVAVRWSPVDAKVYSIGAKFTGFFSPTKPAQPREAVQA